VGNNDPFIPYLAAVQSVVDLTPDVKLFTVEFNDPAVRESFTYRPGQFAFVSVFGMGEVPFGITSVAQRNEGLQFAVRRVGTVTNALHEVREGDTVGVRGPFGNSFPLEDYEGKNIFIIGGGIGMAPLRPVINTVLDRRDSYGDLLIINGARTPQDLVFAPEFDIWAQSPRTKVELTVDRGDDNWTGRVALIPDVVRDIKPSSENMIAITCGPPIMIHFTLQALKELNFADRQIVTTLESNMKCGLGKCARCNVGDKYVCKDGPVFDFEQISQLFEEA
jgi:sulfhydrogenase subunit gamma (sulfur reductase)